MSGTVWHVVAASVQGVSHKRLGLPCQDAHGWRALPDGVLAAAVADGAGSAAHAEVGATAAARAAVDALAGCYQDGLDADHAIREVLIGALRAARRAVEAAAEANDLPLRELATTLIVVLATANWVAAAQVGDGAAVSVDLTGDLCALTIPPEAEYANETVFLTSPGALETAQFALQRGANGQIALFSDGLQRLALRLPGGEPHAPFFTPLLRFAAAANDGDLAREQLTAFLTSPRIAERADDDLTLLLATLNTGANGDEPGDK